jgi:hypothetical protein
MENIYTDIVYVHITRNIDDQITSFQRTWMSNKSYEGIHNYITITNTKITNFLNQKKRKFLHINMSDNPNFLSVIKNFIQDEKLIDFFSSNGYEGSKSKI